MQLRPFAITSVALLSLSLTACEAVEFIFKAGVWVGILGILGLVVVAAVIMGMIRR